MHFLRIKPQEIIFNFIIEINFNIIYLLICNDFKDKNMISNKKEKEASFFKDEASLIKNELEKLICDQKILHDVQYLRKLAICIKQIQYNAKRLSLNPKIRKKAKAIERFLQTPLIHPFTEKMSLAEAAISFSVQDPSHSDLKEILQEIASQGKGDFLHLFELSRSQNPVGEG